MPTDANGMYSIAGIPEGRYVVGVSSAKTDFNLDYALYVKAGELGKLSVSLAPGAGPGNAGGSAGEEEGLLQQRRRPGAGRLRGRRRAVLPDRGQRILPDPVRR